MLLSFGWLVSCETPVVKRYSEEEIVRIMLDAHTLGLVYNRQAERNDTLKTEYYEVLEHRYGLDQEEFDELVKGLVKNSELYDRVYGQMAKKTEHLEQYNIEGLYE